MTNEFSFKNSLASILHSLETDLMSESEAMMVLQGVIDREVDLPSYIAFKQAMVHPEPGNCPGPTLAQRRSEVANRRAALMSVDDPAYLRRQPRELP